MILVVVAVLGGGFSFLSWTMVEVVAGVLWLVENFL